MEIVDIGKSRFCEEWLDCITNEPHILIRFHCSPHHRERSCWCKARHSSASTGPYKDNGPSPPSLVLLMLIVAFCSLPSETRPERSPSD
jgi:hypothetical protein